jgi:hypothetical protein
MMAEQLNKVFYNYDGTLPHLPPKPSKEEIERYLASDECPLSKIIVRPGSTAEGGNESALRLMKTFAFNALLRRDHSCRGMNIGMYGSTGQGKTYVAEKYAETMGIPMIKLNAGSIESTMTILDEIKKVMANFGSPLQEGYYNKSGRWIEAEDHFTVPPCIVFIDEAHKLKKSLVECALLNPMEAGDGSMYCTERRNGPIIVVDVKEVCWVIATTDEAKLFSAFRRRLNSIQWNNAGPDELKLMVKMRMDKDFANGEIPMTMPLEACGLIYKYQQIPGKAIDFARNMVLTRNRLGGSWEETCEAVRKALGFDEHGMHFQQLAILKALGQHPIAVGNLNIVARCEQEKVEQDHLPEMTCFVNDRPWCKQTHRGMAITRNGLAQLDIRGIPHNGNRVTAEAIMDRSAA